MLSGGIARTISAIYSPAFWSYTSCFAPFPRNRAWYVRREESSKHIIYLTGQICIPDRVHSFLIRRDAAFCSLRRRSLMELELAPDSSRANPTQLENTVAAGAF